MDDTISTALLPVDNACMIYRVINKLVPVSWDVSLIFKAHCVKVI